MLMNNSFYEFFRKLFQKIKTFRNLDNSESKKDSVSLFFLKIKKCLLLNASLFVCQIVELFMI